MNNNICRNCDNELIEGKCNNCGYAINSNPFENVINNRKLKEQIGDNVLSLLVNNKLITLEQDAKNLIVQFGYLLLPKDTDKPAALLKVVTAKKLLKPSKVFYVAIQKGEMMILGDNFNEETFRKVSADMLTMNGIDTSAINKKQYIMELY